MFYRNKEYFWFAGCLLWIILIHFSGAFCSPAKAEYELQKMSYTNITLIQHDYMFVYFRGCDRDIAKFTFSATESKGINNVKVVACVPLFGKTKFYLEPLVK
jgi:hypothetical protein